MALEQIRRCDVTEEIGAEIREFEIGSQKFRIDLVDAPWGELTELLTKLEPFITAAEDTTPGTPTLPAQKKVTGPDAADVRKWAADNFPADHEIDGKKMSEKGRIPKVWADAYLTSQKEESKAPTPAAGPVTAEPYEEDDVDETYATTVPGRLEDDDDRAVAE